MVMTPRRSFATGRVSSGWRFRADRGGSWTKKLRLGIAGLVLLIAPLPAASEHCHPTTEEATSHQDSQDPHATHRQHLAGGGDVDLESADGLTVPDVPVVDQQGRELDFYSDLVEGKVVAMNFIFTTCTTICPPMGANFAKLQRQLGERAGRDVHLISVSVDPVTDTPERLEAWGKIFGAGPGWTLVTGTRSDITHLLKGLQVFTPDVEDHSPVVILGNAAEGRWTRAYGLAPPDTLAEISLQLAHADHDHSKMNPNAGGAP